MSSFASVAQSTDTPLSVSELTARIKGALEERFPDVVLEGEISNFKTASSGHLYFTLKDDASLIQAVMFRNRAYRLPFTPEDGQLVHVRGNVSVYARRGNYQIICESMQLAGTGSILAMLEERKRKLASEGLFEESRKRQLPPYPNRVAIVTSKSGAAIRDFLNVTGRRHAGINLVICPTLVQGEEAAQQIATQIRRADRFALGEIIVVTRGGGSLEDLLPFSDERVVRAIAAAETPVVSAVGHETDVSLSDLAADYRAPTPSAAAELVSANREELLGRVMTLGQHMISAFKGKLDYVRMLVNQFSTRNLEQSFRRLVQPLYLRLDDAKEHLVRSMELRVTSSRHRVELASERLKNLSPLAVLERGFAIVTNNRTGKAVHRASDTAVSDSIHVRFSEDALNATVEEHESDE
jgi:exodeoxyribonuclease VII large subunit